VPVLPVAKTKEKGTLSPGGYVNKEGNASKVPCIHIHNRGMCCKPYVGHQMQYFSQNLKMDKKKYSSIWS
jgi:hypothetical protein